MTKRRKAGQGRAGSQTVKTDIGEIEVDTDVIDLSPSEIQTTFELATSDEYVLLRVPVSAVFVVFYALAYFRHNPAVDGVLKSEADDMSIYLGGVLEDIMPDAASSLAKIDGSFAQQAQAESEANDG